MTNVFYNPLSDNRHGEENAKKIAEILSSEELNYIDLTKTDLSEIVRTAPKDDKIVIAGGDGTIHFIINKFGGKFPDRPLYYFPTGCGNDFKRDIGKTDSDVFILNDYLKNLPTVSVNGCKRIYFFNGVGFGIDGYCCEEGDKLKKQTDKPINYASIAIKGMLFYFKPRNAIVTVDGVKHEYKNIWLAPTMNGRFYGGGMIIAPNQDRMNPDHTLSTVIFHCKSKLKTLTVFPSIFKGKHIEHEKMVEVITGRNVAVEFDRPTPLQVDGETYVNVTRYSVSAKETAAAETDLKETAANV